jgi:hypothetical protein
MLLHDFPACDSIRLELKDTQCSTRKTDTGKAVIRVRMVQKNASTVDEGSVEVQLSCYCRMLCCLKQYQMTSMGPCIHYPKKLSESVEESITLIKISELFRWPAYGLPLLTCMLISARCGYPNCDVPCFQTTSSP